MNRIGASLIPGPPPFSSMNSTPAASNGESSLTKSFMHAKGQFPSSVSGSGVLGTIATLGAVAAGVAIVEAALIP
jgi:hypothetical protein